MADSANPSGAGSKPGFDAAAAIDPSKALVPSVVRVNEVRVQQGFWPKFRRVAARAPFSKDLLSVFYAARDPETPFRAKGMMLAALAYFVMPADAIPDILAGVGYTDDIAVLMALMGLMSAHVKPKHKQAAREVVDRIRDEREG